MLQQGVLALEPVGSQRLFELASATDHLKTKMLDAFDLNQPRSTP